MNPGHQLVAPRPHPRVVQSTVAGEHVLFHLDDRRLHVLNPSAGAVWSALGDALTVGDIAHRVSDRFGVAPVDVRPDIERLLDRFRSDGLVTLNDRLRSSPPCRSAPAALGMGDRTPPSGSYRALDAALALECDDTELTSVLDAALAPLRADGPPSLAVRVDADHDGRCTVVVGEREPVSVASRLGAVLRVLAEVNEAAVASAPDDLLFHAGAAVGDDGAVLLPAAANHGKSTLTTALVRSGLGYLTDEAAAVGGGLVVRPFAKSIALDPGSFPLFPELAPSCVDGLAGALAGREWHVDPRRVGTVAGPAPVRVVVCPHWRAGASTRVHRCAPTEAMQLLLGESFDFAAGGQPVFDRLSELVETVPVYRLGYGDLADAVHRVHELLADPG